MKRTLAVSLALALISLGTLSMALPAAPTLRINVPFAFCVGKSVLPAGEYIFEMGSPTGHSATAGAIFIRRADGEAVQWVWTMPSQNVPRNPGGRATFHRYGDTYFLFRVECNEYIADLRVTPRERELLAEVITIK